MDKHMAINSTLKIRHCDRRCSHRSWLTDSHWTEGKKKEPRDRGDDKGPSSRAGRLGRAFRWLEVVLTLSCSLWPPLSGSGAAD